MLWLAVFYFCVLVNGGHFTLALTSRSYNTGRSHKLKLVYVGGLLVTNASEMFSSIENAIRDINNHPSILANYQLQFIFAKSEECDVTRGFETYLDFVDTLPRKHLLLNGLCTEILRKIDRESRTPHGNARILQVSFENSNPTFDSTFQSSLFRLFPSETAFSYPRTELIQGLTTSKHSRIGLIYQNIPTYSLAHNEQVNQLLQEGYVRLESEGFDEPATNFELRALLRRHKEKNVSVLVGNFDAFRARQIICLAYQEGMFGEHYSWILAGNYEPNWWRLSYDATCSTKEMERVMDGMFRIDILPFYGSAMDTKIEDHFSFHQSRRNSKIDGYVYDAMWAMAFALHNVSYHYAKITHSPHPSPQDDFISNNSISFQNQVWDEALHQSLASVAFQGVTGHVSFNKKQGRVGYILLVKQFQATASAGYDEVNIAEFNSLANKLNFAKFPHRMIKRKSHVLESKSVVEKQTSRENLVSTTTEFADERSNIPEMHTTTSGCSIRLIMKVTSITATIMFMYSFQHRLC